MKEAANTVQSGFGSLQQKANLTGGFVVEKLVDLERNVRSMSR